MWLEFSIILIERIKSNKMPKSEYSVLQSKDAYCIDWEIASLLT